MKLIPLGLELSEAAFAIETAAYAFPWSKTIFTAQLQKPDSAFAACMGDKLIGFAIIQRIFPEAELLNIAIDPRFQHQGLGQKLLTLIIELLKLQNYERFFLEVRESNTAAIHLYEKSGFNQIGERNNYYPSKHGRENALLYAIELKF